MEQKRMYESVAKSHSLKTNKIRNAIVAFVVGGALAVASQYLFVILQTNLDFSKENATSTVIIIIIIISAFLTGLGVYDKLAQICGAGLFIPISGFANALASSALESKSEGLIYGIGSNMFKLAGSVITYGIVSVYFLGILRYFFGI